MAERLPACLLLSLALAGPAAAQSVACHVTYGGESRIFEAHPVASPYGVPTAKIGSFFRFRVVLQAEPADLAAVKVYTYADRGEAPVLIHQTSHPYPPAQGGVYGFTGLNAVYEPGRDGELQYWCEIPAGKES